MCIYTQKKIPCLGLDSHYRDYYCIILLFYYRLIILFLIFHLHMFIHVDKAIMLLDSFKHCVCFEKMCFTLLS
eukprot:UN21396